MIAVMKSGKERLTDFLAWGIVAAIAGGAIAGLAWPRTEIGTFGGAEKHGSLGWALAGLTVLWIGNLILSVAIIGFGVKLGREASPRTD